MDYMFEKGKFVEDDLEHAVIELFEQQDYEYIPGETLHRKYEDILLEDDLRAYLNMRYADEHLSEIEIRKIINKIDMVSASPLYTGNRDTFWFINGGFNLTRDDVDQLALHIDYINFDEPENNIFKVVNQYSVQGSRLRRPDLLVFINGIPVAIFEFKTAVEEDKTVHDAWEQITIRYCRDIPKLMKYCFLSVISDGANTKMGSIFTQYPYYYSWNKANDQDKVSNGISSLFTMIEGAFAKDRIIAILRDFIFYPDDSHKDEAIVCRYPQFFAANKMFENIKMHLRPAGDGKGGTYFGATGCGKTYTMMFLARMLMQRDNETFHNPTIILITDRDDLDDQTSKLFVTATKFLGDEDVRSIENRDDLQNTLRNHQSGGIYITTIQKFCEKIGLLSDRDNIICISDEAHRTQTNLGEKLNKTDAGITTTYGFAKYLRDSFPNATYCGFTGTPIDETLAVFGPVVDNYTMKESSDDGITVRIVYESRLARAVLSDEQAKDIQKYYERCADEGSTIEQIEESKKAMSRMSVILKDPDTIASVAEDIVTHYDSLCAEKPDVVQKAMIVCADRQTAYLLLKAILKIRPDWGEARKAEDENALTKDQLDKLMALPKINLVATQGQNDEKELYDLCGTKEYRKMLDNQFKNDDSNFKIAVVVDMWITGFDVPSLAVMYIYKPLQRHTLIQTISRVNRVYEGKDKGLIVDYIGIEKNMMDAVKEYGDSKDSPVDELNATIEIFRDLLNQIDKLMSGFDPDKYYTGSPLEQLTCLNEAAEYVQVSKDLETNFMDLSLKMKSAFDICFPSGELNDAETARANFYIAIRAIIYKQTKGDAPDTESMNCVVSQMVQDAIDCSGVEDIITDEKPVDLFSDEFTQEVANMKMPNTKYNALLKLLRRSIRDYSKANRTKATEFDKRLRDVVDDYNSRDKYIYTKQVVDDFIDDLSDKLLQILQDLETDKTSFEEMGITFEEKAFYDILVKVRYEHQFEYPDDKCIVLAKKIKELVDEEAQYADWSTRDDIKSQLSMKLKNMLYEYDYPIEWGEEVYNKVMEQAESFEECDV